MAKYRVFRTDCGKILVTSSIFPAHVLEETEGVIVLDPVALSKNPIIEVEADCIVIEHQDIIVDGLRLHS